MGKSFRLFGMALMGIFLCTSCSNENDKNEPSVPKDPIEDFEQGDMNFTEKAGEQSFTFTANVDWNLSVASTSNGASWCTVSPNKGSAGTQTIKVNVSENDTYDNRSVTITLKAGTESKYFVVTQKQKDAILLTSDKFEVNQQGGTIHIEVKANVEYTAEIGETCKDWIKEAPNTRGLNTTTKVYTIAANEDSEKREGSIVFSDGTQTEIVHVYQAGGDIILLTQNEYYADAAGEDITVEIKSNCEYEVEMPDVDWVHEIQTRGMSSHTLYYTIDANESYDSREAKIVYRNKTKETADTLTITQAQKDAIVLNQKEYNVDVMGETIEVKVASNTDYSVIIAPEFEEWISLLPNTKGLIAHTLYFKIAANQTDKKRIGEISLNSKETKETISITQNQPVFEIISEKALNISPAEETIEIKFNTNINYTISIRDDGMNWIKKVREEAEQNTLTHKAYFKIAENKETTDRNSQLIFTANDIDYIVDIKQEGVFNGVVEIKEAGSLSSLLKGKSDTITSLKVIGNLNGSDIFFLRGMAGGESGRGNRPTSKGKLHNLDLLDANIVSGGDAYYYKNIYGPYYSEYVTEDNTLSEFIFHGCRLLSSIKLPMTATKIEKDAFTECPLESITVPNVIDYPQADSFIYYVFGGNIKEVHITDLSLWNKCLHFQFPSEGWNLYINGKLITETKIPDGTEYIRPFAFKGCKSLAKVFLPNTVISIGKGAFSDCSELDEINIPSKVSIIDNAAFYRCVQLTSIDIPQSTSSIGFRAFYGCSELEKITIRGSQEKAKIGKEAFYGCKKIQSIIIPNTITEIGEYALAECTNLNSITIGDGITLIPSHLCYHCDKLSTIILGSSVSFMGEYAFYNSPCTEIHSKIKRPDKINYGVKVFGNIKNTCTLYIPKGCKKYYENSTVWKNFKTIVEE